MVKDSFFLFSHADNQKIIHLEKTLKGIAHRTRLRILILCKNNDDITPAVLKTMLKLNTKTYNFHIKVLKLLNLIDIKKKNEKTYFHSSSKALKILTQLQLD